VGQDNFIAYFLPCEEEAAAKKYERMKPGYGVMNHLAIGVDAASFEEALAHLQAVGVHDVRTKVLGSTNPHNVVRATFDALLRMKDPMELARLRGKQLEEI